MVVPPPFPGYPALFAASNRGPCDATHPAARESPSEGLWCIGFAAGAAETGSGGAFNTHLVVGAGASGAALGDRHLAAVLHLHHDLEQGTLRSAQSRAPLPTTETDNVTDLLVYIRH